MDINKKLKDRRKELHLTMLEVAQKVGVSEATVSRWESGDIANMRRDKIALLANALQVTPAFIMEWGTDNTSNDATNEVYYDINKDYTPTEKTLVSNFRLLNPKGQEIIIDTMDMALTKHKKEFSTAKESEYKIASHGGIANEESLPSEPGVTSNLRRR